MLTDVSVTDTPGWTSTVSADRITWTGGPLTGEDEVKLTFTATLPAGATTLEFQRAAVLRQRRHRAVDRPDTAGWAGAGSPGAGAHDRRDRRRGTSRGGGHRLDRGRRPRRSVEHERQQRRQQRHGDRGDRHRGDRHRGGWWRVLLRAVPPDVVAFSPCVPTSGAQSAWARSPSRSPGRSSGGWAASCPSARNRSRRSRASTCGRWSGTRAASARSARGYWNAPIFSPTRGAFAFSDPQPLTGAVFHVLTLLGIGATVAYALILLGALTLNGVAAARLLDGVGAGFVPASLGGALMVALPFVANEFGVLQLMMVFPMLFGLDALFRYFRAPGLATGRDRRACGSRCRSSRASTTRTSSCSRSRSSPLSCS